MLTVIPKVKKKKIRTEFLEKGAQFKEKGVEMSVGSWSLYFVHGFFSVRQRLQLSRKPDDHSHPFRRRPAVRQRPFQRRPIAAANLARIAERGINKNIKSSTKRNENSLEITFQQNTKQHAAHPSPLSAS